MEENEIERSLSVVKRKHKVFTYILVILVWSITLYVCVKSVLNTPSNIDDYMTTSGDNITTNSGEKNDLNNENISWGNLDDFEIEVNGDIQDILNEDNSNDFAYPGDDTNDDSITTEIGDDDNFENHIQGEDDKFDNDKSEIVITASNRVIDPTKPMIALTFDDGPDPRNTQKILDILKENNSVASFFDIGSQMEKYPELVRKELEAGCDVGGHTYSHVDLSEITEEEAIIEIDKTAKTYKDATGLELKYIRPPYGNASKELRNKFDYPFIAWSVDSIDWSLRNADKIIDQVKKTEELDGKIVLMHGTYDTTVEAVRKLVPELIKEGYQLVTVTELAEFKGYDLQNGKMYYWF